MNKLVSVMKIITIIAGVILFTLIAFVNPDDSRWLKCILILLVCVVVCILNMYVLDHIYYMVGYLVASYVMHVYKVKRNRFNSKGIHILDVLFVLSKKSYNKSAIILAYHFNNSVNKEA